MTSNSVTPDLLLRELVQPWCRKKNEIIHLTKLPPLLQQMITTSIPVVIRNNPDRYPYLYPTNTSHILAHKLSDPNWVKMCSNNYGDK